MKLTETHLQVERKKRNGKPNRFLIKKKNKKKNRTGFGSVSVRFGSKIRFRFGSDLKIKIRSDPI